MTANRLKELWAAGGSAVGGWAVMGSPFAAELVAVAGFDYLTVDCQHGLSDLGVMVPMLQAVSRTGPTPLVRVTRNEPGAIGKALDAGAEGVIVPMVNTPEEAALAVAGCRYAPHGVRSYGPVRSGMFLGSDTAYANAQVLCLVMIETVEGVAAADAICATPGVDGVYVGPADLAVSMGMSPAEAGGSREHADALDHVRRACEAHGVIPGIHTSGGAAARAQLDAGFRMVTVSTDAALLRAAATAELAAARGEGGRSVTPRIY